MYIDHLLAAAVSRICCSICLVSSSGLCQQFKAAMQVMCQVSVTTEAHVTCITHQSRAAAMATSAYSMRAYRPWQSHALLQVTGHCQCLQHLTHLFHATDSSCLHVQEACEAGVLAARWRLKASEATKQVSRALLPCASEVQIEGCMPTNSCNSQNFVVTERHQRNTL